MKRKKGVLEEGENESPMQHRLKIESNSSSSSSESRSVRSSRDKAKTSLKQKNEERIKREKVFCSYMKN